MLSLHQKGKVKASASMSLEVFERDEPEFDPLREMYLHQRDLDKQKLKELEEIHQKLEKQKQELEKKVRAQNQKAQQHAAAAETKKAIQVIPKLLDLYAVHKSKKKKKRLQRKIDKLEINEFAIDIQITLLEGRAKVEEKPVYDDESPIKEKSALNKSLDKDMVMNNDELRETIHAINKDIKYMQLKSLAKLGSYCQPMLKKPFISMKNNLCKGLRSDGKGLRSD